MPQLAAVDEQGIGGKAVRCLATGLMLSLGAVFALGLSPSPVKAASVVFELDEVHSEDNYTPSGLEPWVIATFTETTINSTSGLLLTLDASGLQGDEHLKDFQFNIDPFISTTASYQDGVMAENVEFDEDSINKGGGDGFDAAVLYFNSESNRLGAGDFSQYFFSNLTVDHVTQVTSSGLYVLAHIGGVFDPDGSAGNTDGSLWITGEPSPVPLPPSAFLFLAGLVGIGLLARRRRAPVGVAAA